MSKVLFLCDIALLNPKRGTPIHVARLLQELRREHDLVVCAASVPEALNDVFVPYPRERGFKKLRAMLRIVDAHTPQTVLTIGQTGLLAPVILKYLRGLRIVVELQGVEYVEKYAAGAIGSIYFYFWKYKTILLLPLYDAVLAFSRLTIELYPFLRQIGIVYPAIDIETVPQVVSHDSVPPLIACYSGNMDVYQGLPHLIEAVSVAHTRGLDVRMHLILSGDDAKVHDVQVQIAKLNLTRVTSIVRNVSQGEAQREMLNASVLVIPRPSVLESVYGFPSKLPEGLATGLPVIVTDVGGVSELMPELGEHAIVIPAENVTNHLADALQRVAGMSVDERKKLGDGARAYAQKFSWEHVTPIVSNVL